MVRTERRGNDEICPNPMTKGFEWRSESWHNSACASIGALTFNISGLVFGSVVQDVGDEAAGHSNQQ